jgi:hypothetical protein
LKIALNIFSFLFPVFLFSQSKVTEEIKISKSKLTEIKSVKEILGDIPAKCLIGSFECSANMNGSIATVTNNSDDINAVTRSLFELLEKKNKFYISNIKGDCPGALKKEYSFVVVE